MSNASEQMEFKSMVKQWLKSHRLDYRWVAERCGVSEITVRNWMSQKNIPPLKQQLIERIMVQLPTNAAPDDSHQDVPGVTVNASMALTVHLAPDLYEKLNVRAQAEGLTAEALVARAIAGLVKEQSPMRTREVILPPQQ